jgi:hypothetical protein
MFLIMMPEPSRKLMTKRQPLFLNQLLKPPYRAVPPIEQYLRESGQLSRTVPPVSAVHEYVILMIDDTVHYIIHGGEYIGGKVHILGVLDGLEVTLRVTEDVGLSEIVHLLDRISHCMDVIDVAKLDLTVRVILWVFNTPALDTVGVGGCPGAGIENH